MKRTLLFIAALLFIAEGYIITLVFPELESYLVKNEKINGNILVIEGWLSFNDLKLAAVEAEKSGYDYIMTTGLQSNPEFFGMHRNGFLIFYIPDSLRNVTKIEIAARSNDSHPAMFKIIVGNEESGLFSASRKKKSFPVTCDGSSVDSVVIEFLSDDISVLLVKELILNDDFHIPFLNNSEYDMARLDNKERIVNDFTSNAGLTGKRLAAFGADPLKIIPVSAERVRVNRTLTSAIALKEWLENSNIEVKGINIVSSGSHSLRTWMTFRHVLGDKTDTGILALPGNHKTGLKRYLRTFREILAFLYYSLVLSIY